MYNSLQGLPRKGVKIHVMSDLSSKLFNYTITELAVLLKVIKLSEWKVEFNLLNLISTETSVFSAGRYSYSYKKKTIYYIFQNYEDVQQVNRKAECNHVVCIILLTSISFGR